MKQRIFQAILWIAFFLGWQRVVYFYIDNIVNRILFTAFDVVLIMLAFYSIFTFVMPRYFAKNSKWALITGILLTIILTGMLSVGIMQLFLYRNIVPIRFSFSWDYDDLTRNRFYIALGGTLAGLVTWLSIDRLQTGRKLEAAEKMRIGTELMYLKMQTNPHFLFNAINNIYIQVDVSREDAKQTLHTFSDMLRYQLYECNQDKVLLEKEIAYLKDYILLQSLSRDERYSIEFGYPDVPPGSLIAPFILIPLIENMFKHVSTDQSPNIINGSLAYKDGSLHFHGFNTFTVPAITNSKQGIGLQNLERRLELLYPGKYSLVQQVNNNVYEVWLTLQLH